MPGLPRSRMARLLLRRSAEDTERANNALVIASVACMILAALDAWCAAALVIVSLCALLTHFAQRILRREQVLAALAEDGGVVSREGGEHIRRVTESTGHREADQ